MVESPAIRHQGLVHLILRRYFRKNFGILFRYGYRYEDLVQEGLYAILRAEPQFDPSSSAESTYYACAVYNWIASRLCTKFIHNKKFRLNAVSLSLDAGALRNCSGHRDANDGDVALIDLMQSRDGVDEDAILERIMLVEAMNRLRTEFPKQHKVICMRYYSGMQSQEVAPMLGCSTSNVGYLTQRGLTNLRAYYAEMQGGQSA